MPNIIPDYIQQKSAREKSDIAAMVAAERESMKAEEVSAATAAPVASPAPAAKPAAPKANTGIITEGAKAIVGGVKDAAQGVFDLGFDAAKWLDENVLDVRVDAQRHALQAPRFDPNGVLDNQTTGGKIVRTLAQVAIPFAGSLRALKGVQMVNNTVKASAVGAAVDFTVLNPEEKHVSDVVRQLAGSDSMFDNTVTQWLSSHPDDSHFDSRLKNTLEGLGIGAAVDGTFKVLKAVKTHFWNKGVDPAAAVEQGAKEFQTDAAHAEAHSQPSVLDKINDATGVSKGGNKAQRRGDAFDAFYSNPENTAKLDAWQAAAERAKDVETLAKGADNTAIKTPYSGAPQLIGHADDPMVKDLGASFSDAMGVTSTATRAAAAEAVPAFARTAEHLVAIRSYRQLQEATLESFRDSFKSIEGSGVVLSASEKKAAKVINSIDLNAPHAATEAEDLAKIAERQKALEAAAPLVGKINPNGTFSFTKDTNGHIEPSSLILAGSHASKQGAMNGAAMGGVSLEQADPNEDPVTKYANAAVAALAVYGGWRVMKHYGATKAAAKDAADVASGLPKSVIEGAKAGSAPAAKYASIAPKATMLRKVVPTIHKDTVNSMVENALKGDYKASAESVLKSDFNMDHIDTPEEVKELIDGFSAQFSKGIDQAKHGTQAFSQIEELAKELGSSTKALRATYENTDNLAAQVLAHRTLMTASAEKVASMSRAVINGGDTVDAILALNKQVTLHAAIQSQMKGIQTEIARSLSAFRITASTANLSMAEKDALITSLGGRDVNMKLAAQLDDIAGDTRLLNSYTRQLGRSPFRKTMDALFEARLFGLLSSPATHVVNVMGNTMNAVMSIAERQTAATIGRYRNVPPGSAVEQAEVKAYILGMYSGLRDAVRLTSTGKAAIWDATKMYAKGDRDGAVGLLRENSSEMGGAIESFFHNAPVLDNAAYGSREYNGGIPALSSQSLEIDPTQFIGKFTDYLGAILGAPGRLLTTSDELFKTVFHRGELNAQAYRHARSEGHEGDALVQRMQQLVDDPTPEIRSQALGAARYSTFTTPLGKTGTKFTELVHSTPGGRWLFPFIKTPTNIAKYMVQHTPGLNLLSSHIGAEMAAGGARRDIAIAKTVVGGGLYALAGGLAAEGFLTGGGDIHNKEEMIAGWRPNSLKLGDKYYEINRLDPVGGMLFMAADITAIMGHLDEHDAGQVASAAVLSIQRNLASKTYLKGVTDLVSAVHEYSSGNEKAITRYMQNFGASFLPYSGASNAIRKELDPEMKEAMTLIDAFKAKIPGMSKDVHPTVNLFGEDQHYDAGVGPDMLSPIATSTQSLDPVANEIARLHIDLKKPSSKITIEGTKESIDLTPDQYYKLQKYSGEQFKALSTKVVSSSQYQNLREEESNTGYVSSKQLIIKKLAAQAQQIGHAKLLQEYPEITHRTQMIRVNKGLALRGEKVLPLDPQSEAPAPILPLAAQ